MKDYIYINYFSASGEKKRPSEKAYKQLKRLIINYMKDNGTEIKESDIEIMKSTKGKPYLCNLPIKFNISYTDGAFIIAISNKEIGVDIENIKSNIDYDNIAMRFYSTYEKKYMDKKETNSPERKIRFFELWTKREAYVKYTGQGIGKNFRNLDMRNNVYGVKIKSIVLKNEVISYCVHEDVNVDATVKYWVKNGVLYEQNFVKKCRSKSY